MVKGRLVLGLDVGATKIAGGIVSIVGKEAKVLKKRKWSTDSTSEKTVIESVVDSIRDLMLVSKRDFGSISAIGVGIAGTVHFGPGEVVCSPNLPLKDIPIKKILTSYFKLPVYVDNDANVAAIGEKYFGVAVGRANVIYLTLGTGIGGSIIVDGKMFRGPAGAAAELGHVIVGNSDSTGAKCGCGGYGCLEAIASGYAIEKKVRKMIRNQKTSLMYEMAKGKPELITTKVVAEAAKKGDVLAKEILLQAGQTIGVALVSLINIFSPEMVVIGGSLAKAGRLILQPAKKTVKRKAIFPSNQARIVKSKLGDKAGILGAAFLAYRKGKV